MRKTHELGVSLSGKNSHNFCSTCSNGSMGGDMATTTKCLFSFEVGHKIDIHPFYNHGKVLDHVLLLLHSSIYYTLVDVMNHGHCLPCNFLKLQWMRLQCILVRNCYHHVSSCKTFRKTLINMFHDDHVLFFMDGLFWASLFFTVGGTFFGGLFFTLPLEGNNFVA